MKVLVTGATGYIGSALADALRSAGHEVTGLARSEEAAERLRTRGFRAHLGDLNDPQSLTLAAHENEATIHTALPNGADAPGADRTAVVTILNALEGTGKPFIYTSGIWVYGPTGDRVVTEESELDPIPLVRWRPPHEQLVLNASERGVYSVVIRPAMVYGHGGGIPGAMINEAKEKGVVRFVGTGENRWPQVHVDDLADLYVRALEHAPAGTLLNASSGESVRLRDVAQSASRAGGAGGRTESWPLEEARRALGPYADALVLDQQVSGRKAVELLGWKPRAASMIEALV